jgi:ELWxxDGT repeat protein
LLSSAPLYLTNVGGTLFFVAVEGVDGREVWKSDGTEAGTALAKDIFPGAGDADPGGLTNVGGNLFFSAHDAVHGTELWKAVVPRQLSIDDLIVNEATATATLSVSASAGTVPASFDYASTDGTATAGVDYTAGSGSKTMPANADSTTIEVPITQDSADEPDENFTVTLSNPDAPNTIAKATATVTITDDDSAANPPPSNDFSLPGNGKANLEKGTLTLEITLPGPGTLSAGQQGFAKSKALIKPTTEQVKAGKNTIVLKPSKTGLKKLKKAAKGPKTGKLKVPTAIAFAPTGGDPNIEQKTYKLKLK